MHKGLFYSLLFTGFLFSLAGISASTGEAEKISFPSGYRDFTHVKSMVISKGHPLFDAFGGIHHVYANDLAISALKAGKAYPDGAMFVFDLLEAIEDGGALTEGKRKVLAVMLKDSGKFAKTGGWGFEAFAGGDPAKPIVTDPVSSCFNCHQAQKDADYVFSTYRP